MNFRAEVIEKSFETPIVIDFWADWCGPCKVLGPVIEELADKANNKWELVKVNTELEPELSSQYKIRGIPAVKMMYKGEIVAEFTGTLPKYQIEQWLNENLPDDRLNKFYDLIENGSLEDLKQFVELNQDLPLPKYELAIRLLKTDPETATELLLQLQAEPKFFDKVSDALAFIEFLQTTNFEELSTGFKNEFIMAQDAFNNDQFEECLIHLIALIGMNKGFANELTRRVCIAIFRKLGEENELTKKYRRRFTMALY